MGLFPCSTTTKRKSKKSKLGFQEHDVNASAEVCGECGKSFRSRKAVYGHTRVHRNRHHRHGSIDNHPKPSPSPYPSSTTTMMRGDEHDVATSLLSLADLLLADVKRAQQPTIDGDDKGEINNVLKISSAGSSGSPNACDSKRPVLDLNLPPPLEKVDYEYEVVLELRLGR